jgi:hypothetical protein
MKSTRREPVTNVVTRLAWLAGCLAAGLAVGALVYAASGRPHGFLAVPAALAVGWFFLADPTKCSTDPGVRGRGRQAPRASAQQETAVRKGEEG